MIQVENLTKYYGTKQALDKISFTVEKGVVLGFLGPNGAGKSTTMKIITGFLSPTEGSVLVDGFDIVNESLEVRKRIGYLPEHPPLYLDMSVKNYLDFAGRIRGISGKKIRDAILNVVEKTGLQKYYKAQCKALSKGYRQRVGIAQALIHEPELLILDEPTIGLDPIQIVEIRELIKTFGGEHTVILSTHILPEVEMTCEKIIIINDGTVVTEGSVEQLRDRLPHNNQLALIVQGNNETFPAKLSEIEGVDNVETMLDISGKTTYKISTGDADSVSPEVARTAVGAKLEIIELKNMSPTLEEVFINITMT